MMWHDRLFCGIDEQQKVQLEKVWDEIETIVFDVARSKVPYSDEQDAWYAPNAAVWSGGWIAALVVCTLIQQGKIEENKSTPEYQWTLGNIWSWFKAGHWPCSFYWTYSQDLEQAERTGAPKLLVIY